MDYEVESHVFKSFTMDFNPLCRRRDIVCSK